MRALQTVLCFAFVASCLAQGDYSGRRRGGFVGGFDMDGGLGVASLMSLQGGGFGSEPAFVKNVLGNSVSGRPLLPGDILEGGFALPRHGGTRDPSGLGNGGWGVDPSIPMISDGWTDPLRGLAFPTDYKGEELVFDSNLNQYVIAKHNAQKAGAVVGGFGPAFGGTNVVHEVNKAGASGIPSIGASPVAAQTGHGLAKSSVGQAAAVVDQQTWGGVSRGEPFANQAAANLAQESLHVAKKTVGMASGNAGAGMPLGGAMIGGGMVGPIAAGKPSFIGGGHVPLSGVSAGTLGVDHPGAIAHKIQKATLGVDATIGHNIAKSANVPTGTGFLNPGVPMVGGGIGGVMGAPIGGAGLFGRNVVHDVNKAGASGIPAIGASPIAAQVGHIAAKNTIGQTAAVVDQQTWGGVSRGEPFANQAAANLAQESLHVAKKTVGMASDIAGAGMPLGGAMIGGGVMGTPMIGAGPIMPVAKKGIVRQTDYGGRSRF